MRYGWVHTSLARIDLTASLLKDLFPGLNIITSY